MIIKEIVTKNIITKSNLPVCDYSVNAYTGCGHACKYCYASFMKRFTGHTEPWGTFIDIKNWEQIKNKDKFKDKELFFSSVTDPYQPIEEEYKRTRKILEELQGSGAIISISTKSDLILRDLDLIKTFKNAQVSFSINTLDENFKNDMDKAVSIERRLNAMKKFYEAGVYTTCFISPIFPEITNCIDIIEKCKNYCNSVWLENLNLRGEYKPIILNYIKNTYPHLLPLYKDIYNNGDRTYWTNLNQKIKDYCRLQNMPYLRENKIVNSKFGTPPTVINFFYHEEIKKSAQKINLLN